jgi:hypothetical protein
LEVEDVGAVADEEEDPLDEFFVVVSDEPDEDLWLAWLAWWDPEDGCCEDPDEAAVVVVDDPACASIAARTPPPRRPPAAVSTVAVRTPRRARSRRAIDEIRWEAFMSPSLG